MRELGHRSGEHRGHARIHRVSAVVVDTHARLVGVFAAGGKSSAGAARGVHGGEIEILALRKRWGDAKQDEEREGQLVLHKADLIITLGLGVGGPGVGRPP